MGQRAFVSWTTEFPIAIVCVRIYSRFGRHGTVTTLWVIEAAAQSTPESQLVIAFRQPPSLPPISIRAETTGLLGPPLCFSMPA